VGVALTMDAHIFRPIIRTQDSKQQARRVQGGGHWEGVCGV